MNDEQWRKYAYVESVQAFRIKRIIGHYLLLLGKASYSVRRSQENVGDVEM